MVASQGALASGDDLRVVVWDGAAWSERDRVVDPLSMWNSSTTTLWFRWQSSDQEVALYLANPDAAAPPANEGNVFHFADFFERNDADELGNGWTLFESEGDIALADGALSFEGSADANNRPIADHDVTPLTAAFAMRLGFRWSRTGDEGTYRLHMQLGEGSAMETPPPTSMAIANQGVGPSLMWAGPNQGMTDHEGLGYEVNGEVTQVRTVSGAAEIELHVPPGGQSLVLLWNFFISKIFVKVNGSQYKVLIRIDVQTLCVLVCVCPGMRNCCGE